MKQVIYAAAAATAIAITPAASAATLIVDGNGQLTGAQGVDVQGTLYDVAFAEGTCTTSNDACGRIFGSANQALLAAQALLDQVFINTSLGNFDSSPFLTSACGVAGPGACNANVAYSFSSFGSIQTVISATAQNASASPFGDLDSVRITNATRLTNTANSPSTFWAVFSNSRIPSPVPEPGTWLMMILGFGAIGGVMRGRSGDARKQNASMRVRYR